MKNIGKPGIGLLAAGIITVGLISFSGVFAAEPLRKAGEYISYESMTGAERKQYDADIKALEKSFAKDQQRMKDLVDKVAKSPDAYKKMTEDEKQIVDFARKTNSSNTTITTLAYDGYANMLPGYYYISVKGTIAGLGTGHAAIKNSQSQQTIEAYPAGGVKRYDKKWNYESMFYKAMAIGSTSTRRTSAVSYAESKIGKPYNNNFYDKWNQTKFYCSQLVWRAWYNQGIDIDDIKFDNIVTPTEVGVSNNTYKFEYRG
jgi:uncharacterized protein YycO